jgi:hypothetical protein
MSKTKKELNMSTRQLFVYQTVWIALIMWMVVQLFDSNKYKLLVSFNKSYFNIVSAYKLRQICKFLLA